MMSGPKKRQILNILTVIGIGYAAYIIYTIYNPTFTLDDCLLQRANEDIGSACLELLLEEGK